LNAKADIFSKRYTCIHYSILFLIYLHIHTHTHTHTHTNTHIHNMTFEIKEEIGWGIAVHIMKKIY
jgi:hypothetical protein